MVGVLLCRGYGLNMRCSNQPTIPATTPETTVLHGEESDPRT